MSFKKYLELWRLAPDGEAVVTATSHLLPVRADGVPAMLKIADHKEERRGNALMEWWAGQGAAQVLAREGGALLMERSVSGLSLAGLARSDRDDDASRAMCAVLDKLHAPRDRQLPDLLPLRRWFEPLDAMADTHGGIFQISAAAASRLLAYPREIAVLHGDMHHANVLDFGVRGWLAIDPKGLIGERYFDFANMLCNPDPRTAIAPGRFMRQLTTIANAGRLDRQRLLDWVIAWTGLSAAFLFNDGLPPDDALEMAQLAARVRA